MNFSERSGYLRTSVNTQPRSDSHAIRHFHTPDSMRLVLRSEVRVCHVIISEIRALSSWGLERSKCTRSDTRSLSSDWPEFKASLGRIHMLIMLMRMQYPTNEITVPLFYEQDICALRHVSRAYFGVFQNFISASQSVESALWNTVFNRRWAFRAFSYAVTAFS